MGMCKTEGVTYLHFDGIQTRAVVKEESVHTGLNELLYIIFRQGTLYIELIVWI